MPIRFHLPLPGPFVYVPRGQSTSRHYHEPAAPAPRPAWLSATGQLIATLAYMILIPAILIFIVWVMF